MTQPPYADAPATRSEPDVPVERADGELVVRMTAGLFACCGALLGLIGGFLVPATPTVLGVAVPLGPVVALANLPLCAVAGWGTGRRAAVIAPFAAWAVVVLVLVVHGGDVVIGPEEDLAPWAFLLLGAAAGGVGVRLGNTFVPARGASLAGDTRR